MPWSLKEFQLPPNAAKVRSKVTNIDIGDSSFFCDINKQTAEIKRLIKRIGQGVIKPLGLITISPATGIINKNKGNNHFSFIFVNLIALYFNLLYCIV